MKNLIRLIFGSLCIVIISAVVGLASNMLRPDGLPLIRKPLRETRSFATKEQLTQSGRRTSKALFTTLQDAKEMFDSKTAIFVDARPVKSRRVENIPGAVSLSYENLGKTYASVLGSAPKNRLIVIFACDPECVDSVKLADALVARGHSKVVVLVDGLRGWKDAGFPTASGKEQ